MLGKGLIISLMYPFRGGVLCAIWCLAIAAQQLPGAKIRITNSGLIAISSIAQNVLTKEMNTATIADIKQDINEGPGSGSIDVSSIKIHYFQSPAFSYTLQPPNSIVWSTRGGTIKLSGDWYVDYDIIFSIHSRGSFEVTAKELDIKLTLALQHDEDGHPKIHVSQCQAEVNKLDIHTEGHIVGKILNLFRKVLDKIVKEVIKRKVCNQAVKYLNTWANDQLNTIPTYVDIGSNLTLDYRFTQDVEVSNRYIESYHNAEIHWFTGDEHAPFQPTTMPQSNLEGPKMMYIWCSEYIMKSLLYASYKHQQISFLMDKFTAPDAAPYLVTDCWLQCVGAAFPALYKQFPGKTVSVNFVADDVPNFYVEEKDARLQGNISAIMFMDKNQTKNNTDVHLLTISIFFDAIILPTFTNMTIAGTMHVKSIVAKISKTNVGTIPQMALDLLIGYLSPTLEAVANDFLKAGVPIPTVQGVSLVDTELVLLNNTIQLGANLHYVG